MTRKEKRRYFGDWLKQVRERAGLTQADLATKLNYDNPQIISNIERGVSALPSRRIADFANALDCPLEDIELRFLASAIQNEQTAKTFEAMIEALPVVQALTSPQTSENELLSLIHSLRKEIRQEEESEASDELSIEKELG